MTLRCGETKPHGVKPKAYENHVANGSLVNGHACRSLPRHSTDVYFVRFSDVRSLRCRPSHTHTHTSAFNVMSENQDLLKRISQLAGHINLHKGKLDSAITLQSPSGQSSVQPHSLPQVGSGERLSGRGASYNFTRGVSRKKPFPKSSVHPYRNRSLVLTQGAPSQPSERVGDGHTSAVHTDQQDEIHERVATQPTNWIKKFDRHAQLINSSVYDKEVTQRTKAIEQTRQERSLHKDRQERSKIHRHLAMIASRTEPPSAVTNDLHIYKVSVHGLQFQVCDGGSKLIRVRSTSHRSALQQRCDVVI